MHKYFLVIVVLSVVACNTTTKHLETEKEGQEKVLSDGDKYRIATYWEKASKSRLHSQERQLYLDSILAIKPDSAYFWQQKAMPLYKVRKYALGKPFLANAVKYDPERYMDYSAFMKCLFSKEYQESIEEFMEVKKRYGDSFVMDHTYNFYIALCYLQLNQFKEAEMFLQKSKEQQFTAFPDDPPHEACHYIDWLYLGITAMELGNYQEAINRLDQSLKVYPNFADALYYKALCYGYLGDKENANTYYALAKENRKNTFNEDQVFYELYPYQVFHKLSPYSQ